MATTTFHDYDGDGSDKTFDYTFPTYAQTEVIVEVNNVIVDNYTIPNYTTSGTNTVTFDNSTGTLNTNVCESDGSPKAGTANVRIYRDTNVDSQKHTYQAGSSVKAGDLNTEYTHLLRALQEEQNQTITTSDIKDGAITSAKIEDGTIVAADIANDAINSQHYAADSIDAEHYAPNSVDTTALANDAVTGAQLANDSVDSEHYVDGSIDLAHLASASVDTGNLVNRAVTGIKIDVDTINTDNYAPNSVDADALAHTAVTAGSYTATDLTVDAQGRITAASSGTIARSEIAADAVDGSLIADDAVDSEHIAADSIDSEHYAPNSVDTTALAADAVTGDQIADNAIDSEHYVDGSIDRIHLEADIIDSTKIEDNAVGTEHIADAELTTLAGMQSGTASILAGGTALTATLSELNLLDGKSIVTTISSPTDVQIPTAQAVDERIIDLVTDVGGFRPIANETSFPATNPDPEDNAGTIVSVKALASNLTSNGSGVATIANGAGSGNTVTITGMANSDTIEAGKGILVETTSTLHTYTFHRETLAPADITAANTAVSDFNDRYRILASGTNINTVGSLDDGDLLWDSNVDKMKVYDATASAWKEVTSTGEFKYLFLCPDGGTGAPSFPGASYDLREGSNSGSVASVTNAAQLLVSINGVIQKANTGTSAPAEGFAMADGNNIKFGSNITATDTVFIVQIGSAVSIPTPGDDTVSTVKIQNLAVTGGKIADDTITEVKLDIHQAPSDGKFLKYTSSNGMEWGDVPAGVGGATGVDFNDGVKARWGTGNDLEIYHIADTRNLIKNVDGSTIPLELWAQNVNIQGVAGSAYSAKFSVTGGQELYFGGAKKAETVTGGFTITGACTATSFAGDGSALTGIASTTLDGCGYENDDEISAGTYSIASGKGVNSVGPITNNGTVTVNGRWVIH